jgi:NADH:ubiquinone oxidoreductase subunit E
MDRKRGSEALMASLLQSTEAMGMDVMPCKCLGMCKTGPHIKARMGVSAHEMQDLHAAEM